MSKRPVEDKHTLLALRGAKVSTFAPEQEVGGRAQTEVGLGSWLPEASLGGSAACKMKFNEQTSWLEFYAPMNKEFRFPDEPRQRSVVSPIVGNVWPMR